VNGVAGLKQFMPINVFSIRVIRLIRGKDLFAFR